MLASSMAPVAVFACCTSFSSSPAIERCLSSGWASGDSRIGSIGSSGLIRWARMQTLGSATSSTLSGPGAVAAANAVAAAAADGDRCALLAPVLTMLSFGSLGGGSCVMLNVII